jgi:hypothetical protein
LLCEPSQNPLGSSVLPQPHFGVLNIIIIFFNIGQVSCQIKKLNQFNYKV